MGFMAIRFMAILLNGNLPASSLAAQCCGATP